MLTSYLFIHQIFFARGQLLLTRHMTSFSLEINEKYHRIFPVWLSVDGRAYCFCVLLMKEENNFLFRQSNQRTPLNRVKF